MVELDEERFKEIYEEFKRFVRKQYSRKTAYSLTSKVRTLYHIGALTKSEEEARCILREHGYYSFPYMSAWRKFNAFVKYHWNGGEGNGHS